MGELKGMYLLIDWKRQVLDIHSEDLNHQPMTSQSHEIDHDRLDKLKAPGEVAADT
jgi:hypothetical protein